jgi:hypothetical protein
VAHRIVSLLQPLLGLPCWQVQWERHTNLSMEFGTPSLEIREPHATAATSARVRELASYRQVTLRGAWMLWILHAYWRLRLRDGQIIAGASSQRQRQYRLSRLDGQYLRTITIAPQTARTIFQFDLGAELSVRRWRRSDEDVWMIYTPDAYVLTLRCDGQWQYASATQASDSLDIWTPLEAVVIVSEPTK